MKDHKDTCANCYWRDKHKDTDATVECVADQRFRNPATKTMNKTDHCGLWEDEKNYPDY